MLLVGKIRFKILEQNTTEETLAKRKIPKQYFTSRKWRFFVSHRSWKNVEISSASGSWRGQNVSKQVRWGRRNWSPVKKQGTWDSIWSQSGEWDHCHTFFCARFLKPVTIFSQKRTKTFKISVSNVGLEGKVELSGLKCNFHEATTRTLSSTPEIYSHFGNCEKICRSSRTAKSVRTFAAIVRLPPLRWLR